MPMFTNDVLIDDQPISVGGTVAVSSVTGTVTVDGSGVTQPVSGTVAVSSVTGTVTVDGSGVTQPVSGTVAVSSVTGTVTVDGSGVTQPVSGTVAVSSVTGTVTVDGSGVTQPVSGTVAVSSVTGTVAVSEAGASTSTVSQLALTASTNATVWAANPARLGAILFIPTASVANPSLVKLGATASATSWTYKAVSNNTTIEIPKSWLGQVDIFAVTAQTVNRTEY